MQQKYYGKINYENGYCGCDEMEYHIIEANNEEEAKQILEDIAEAGLYDYAEDYCHVAEGYDSFYGWETEEDAEIYYSGCYYGYELISKEEYYEDD